MTATGGYHYYSTIPGPFLPTKGCRLPQSVAVNLALLLIIAIVVNLPLGWLREASPRYSWRWFLYIHLSIPLIVALRLAFDFSWRLIPLTLFCAVVGQFIGGRWQRRRHP